MSRVPSVSNTAEPERIVLHIWRDSWHECGGDDTVAGGGPCWHEHHLTVVPLAALEAAQKEIERLKTKLEDSVSIKDHLEACDQVRAQAIFEITANPMTAEPSKTPAYVRDWSREAYSTKEEEAIARQSFTKIFGRGTFREWCVFLVGFRIAWRMCKGEPK